MSFDQSFKILLTNIAKASASLLACPTYILFLRDSIPGRWLLLAASNFNQAPTRGSGSFSGVELTGLVKGDRYVSLYLRFQCGHDVFVDRATPEQLRKVLINLIRRVVDLALLLLSRSHPESSKSGKREDDFSSLDLPRGQQRRTAVKMCSISTSLAT